jgi:transcriptional regulator with XRE-family HTH domain
MKYISTNIRHLREQKEFSQEYFAEELKWTRAMIASFESGRTEPSIDKLMELSRYTKIPIDSLIKNDLRKVNDLSFIDIGNSRVLFPITVNEDSEELIEIIPIEASAGYLRGYSDPEYIEHLNKIKLPFLPTGTHRAFPIKGDSMLPVKSGSYIVAKFVEDIRNVKNGNTYIVLTLNDGIVYKRVFDKIDENQSLQLVSDNKRYDAYNVPVNDVLELWEFTCAINTQEYEEHELKISNIAMMLNEVGVELKSLEKLVS